MAKFKFEHLIFFRVVVEYRLDMYDFQYSVVIECKGLSVMGIIIDPVRHYTALYSGERMDPWLFVAENEEYLVEYFADFVYAHYEKAIDAGLIEVKDD